MILKVFKPYFGGKAIVTSDETYVYDGFDNVHTKFINERDDGIAVVPTSCFTMEDTLRQLQIMLFKKEELIRVLFIDLRYHVYLMSNAGKTIERIN